MTRWAASKRRLDALNQITQYAYDEVGNRIAQTDANAHTTPVSHDQRGRRVQRTLPLGMSESYVMTSPGSWRQKRLIPMDIPLSSRMT